VSLKTSVVHEDYEQCRDTTRGGNARSPRATHAGWERTQILGRTRGLPSMQIYGTRSGRRGVGFCWV
jgi:hypothetical protein